MSKSTRITAETRAERAIARTAKAQRQRYSERALRPSLDLHTEDEGAHPMQTTNHIGARYVAIVLGHVPRASESFIAAFERLRRNNPDLFPVPRCDQSFNDAMREVIARHTER